jgi:aminobenzoyl-glutamate utilization protein B
MKKYIVLMLISLLVFKAGAQKKQSNPDTGKVAIDYLNNSFGVYNKLQKQIWSTPELGFLEVNSSAALQKHLADNGFKIEKGVAGMPTAFVATYGSGSPVIGILAEFDALSGLSQDTVPFEKPIVNGANGQGCGHHLLGTASTAAATAIKKWIEATGAKGTLKVFGTPAEEGGGGKVFFAQEGYFKDVDAVLDWHPASENALNSGTSLARISILYTFHGKAAHAAANPEKGRSALDGVEAMDNMVNQLREHIVSDARIHYVITDGGGLSPNVVPAHAQVSYYVRAKNVTELFDILGRVDNAADGAALGTGTTVTKKRLAGAIYPVLPNKTLGKIIQKNLEKVGGVAWTEKELAYASEIAKSTNTPLKDLDKVKSVTPYDENKFGVLHSGSSDVGDVSWNVPVASFTAATFVPGSPGHSWQNVAAGGTTIGTKGAIVAAKVFAHTAIDLFSNPTLLIPIKEEFQKARGDGFKYAPIVAGKPELDYRKEN